MSSGVAGGTAEALQIEHDVLPGGGDRVTVLSEIDGKVDGEDREVFVF